MSHYIHYIKRKVYMRFPDDAKSPWFAKYQSLNEGFRRPVYHITRNKDWPAQEIEEGDTIWIISQLASPWGSLPPALDARIDVKEILLLDDGSIKYLAKDSSLWYPLADMQSNLESLQITLGDGTDTCLIKTQDIPVGFYLRSIKKLSCGNQIVDWANNILKRKSNNLHFVSYRLKDGTGCAFDHVKSLMVKGLNENGPVVFWDRWSLPRRLAERREVVEDESLNSYLLDTIRDEGCVRVAGIESELYCTYGSYSRIEADLAKEFKKYYSVSCKKGNYHSLL